MDKSETDNFVEKVRERSDIYSVVSRYVSLTLKGNKYWACCPFHGEKTPSFTVTPEKGLFYCFGCHAGGNVFHFISRMENIPYIEAVKLQAKRLGIAFPGKTKSDTAEERKIKILFQINEFARKFYHDYMLNTAEGSKGRKYLNARGISDNTIERFFLGYAPSGWENLYRELLKKGYTDEQLFAAGITGKSKNSGKYFDKMRERVIIPITDLFGRVVGFGGRILDDSVQKDIPKYLNTAETAIFKKGNLLFGLDKASKAIFDKKFVIVVEGYMDAISLVSAGFENVVATLGTAFTEEHAKLLKRYTRKVIFCYDSDDAGQRATIRALPIIEKLDTDIFVVAVPDGKDPDEFIQRHGKEGFSELLRRAMPAFDYRLKYIVKNSDISTVIGKREALKKIAPIVAGIKDAVKHSEYSRKVGVALLLDETVVASEISKSVRAGDMTQLKKSVESEDSKGEISLIDKALETIFRVIWNECDIVDYVLSIIPREAFKGVYREMIDYFEKCNAESRNPDDMNVAKELSLAAGTELSRILFETPDNFSEYEMKAFSDSLNIIKKVCLGKKYNVRLRDSSNYMVKDVPAYTKEVHEALTIKKTLDGL